MESKKKKTSFKNSKRLEKENRILTWVTANSKPKVLILPKLTRKLTRFQKPGPMTPDDWLRWRRWVRKFGAPKGKYPSPYRKIKKKKLVLPEQKNRNKIENIRKPNKERLKYLAKPKQIKFIPPRPQYFTFVPKINSPDKRKMHPRKPKIYKLPNDQIIFKVNREALKYKLTEHTKKLAMPIQRDQESNLDQIHRKFSSKQWKLYQQYLKLFSFPKIPILPTTNQISSKSLLPSRADKMKSKERKEIQKKLSQPKKCPIEFDSKECLREKQSVFLEKGKGVKNFSAEKEENDKNKKVKETKTKLMKSKKQKESREELKERRLRNEKRAQPKSYPKDLNPKYCPSPVGGLKKVSFGHGRIRRRHHPRGTKRGRPRGSGRGGKTNNPGRTPDGTPVTTSGTANTNVQGQSTPVTPTGESSNISGTGGGGGGGGGSDQSFETTVPVIKRGPGRPRLKPGGPPNPGYRGAPRTRKPIGPLVVPLGQSPGATPLTRSPAMSPAPSPAHAGVGYYQPNDDDI